MKNMKHYIRKQYIVEHFNKSIVMPPLELFNSIYAGNAQTIFGNASFISLRAIPVTVVESEKSFRKSRY